MGAPDLGIRLRQRKYMRGHLEELRFLLGRVVTSGELGGAADAHAQREAAIQRPAQTTISFEILFSERKTMRFETYFKRLSEANPSPLSIWAEHSIDCGLLVIHSFSEVNFDFGFPPNEDLGFVFSTTDHQDQLHLEFIRRGGTQLLSLEVTGSHWPGIEY